MGTKPWTDEEDGREGTSVVFTREELEDPRKRTRVKKSVRKKTDLSRKEGRNELLKNRKDSVKFTMK